MKYLPKINSTIAVILAFFGPIGYLYIGVNFGFWAFVFTASYVFTYQAVSTSLDIYLPFAAFYGSLLALVYFASLLANMRNAFANQFSHSMVKVKQFKSFAFGFVSCLNLFKLYVQFYTVLIGFYAVYGSFKSGKHEMALVALVALVVVSWLVQVIFKYLQSGLGKLFKIE